MKQQRGFTILELIVVVSILAVVVAGALLLYERSLSRSRFTRVYQDLQGITAAGEAYYDDFKRYAVDVSRGQAPHFVTRGYLSSWPAPPCGQWQAGCNPPCGPWTYDWENWTNVNGVAGWNIMRISVRTTPVPGTGRVAFYYCIKAEGGSCAGSPPQGVDITTTADLNVLCGP